MKNCSARNSGAAGPPNKMGFPFRHYLSNLGSSLQDTFLEGGGVCEVCMPLGSHPGDMAPKKYIWFLNLIWRK
jgi:hypothetical protein